MIIFGGSSASIFVEVELENKSWKVCKWLQRCHSPKKPQTIVQQNLWKQKKNVEPPTW